MIEIFSRGFPVLASQERGSNNTSATRSADITTAPIAPGSGINSNPPPTNAHMIGLKAYMAMIEIDEIVKALVQSKGQHADAARYLKMKRTTLVQKIKKHGLPLSRPSEKKAKV